MKKCYKKSRLCLTNTKIPTQSDQIALKAKKSFIEFLKKLVNIFFENFFILYRDLFCNVWRQLTSIDVSKKKAVASIDVNWRQAA